MGNAALFNSQGGWLGSERRETSVNDHSFVKSVERATQPPPRYSCTRTITAGSHRSSLVPAVHCARHTKAISRLTSLRNTHTINGLIDYVNIINDCAMK
ncbi:hypothetical protein J6590_002336 [Homalodisca vitripennis]|nr:hypothetical protein J6590_002336 [Homalodisca vitripennis]